MRSEANLRLSECQPLRRLCSSPASASALFHQLFASALFMLLAGSLGAGNTGASPTRGPLAGAVAPAASFRACHRSIPLSIDGLHDLRPLALGEFRLLERKLAIEAGSGSRVREWASHTLCPIDAVLRRCLPTARRGPKWGPRQGTHLRAKGGHPMRTITSLTPLAHCLTTFATAATRRLSAWILAAAVLVAAPALPGNAAHSPMRIAGESGVLRHGIVRPASPFSPADGVSIGSEENGNGGVFPWPCGCARRGAEGVRPVLRAYVLIRHAVTGFHGSCRY